MDIQVERVGGTFRLHVVSDDGIVYGTYLLSATTADQLQADLAQKLDEHDLEKEGQQ